MSDKPLYVTEPALPPFEQFEPLLREIWASHRLTNGGPYHDQLEAALAAYLAVPQVSLLANGTLALMLALKALEVEGEVITTPYSFVATTHALCGAAAPRVCRHRSAQPQPRPRRRGGRHHPRTGPSWRCTCMAAPVTPPACRPWPSAMACA
jgi:hypothetical protein